MLDKMFDAPWFRVFTFLFFVAACFAPSMLFFAVYCPAFFGKTEFSKLLLLSVAAAIPLLFLNAFLMIAFSKVLPPLELGKPFESYCLGLLSFASAMSVIPMYAAILLKVFFVSMGYRSGMFVVLLMAILEWVPTGFVLWWHSPCEYTFFGEPEANPLLD